LETFFFVTLATMSRARLLASSCVNPNAITAAKWVPTLISAQGMLPNSPMQVPSA
jgi:hypothetical protein